MIVVDSNILAARNLTQPTTASSLLWPCSWALIV